MFSSPLTHTTSNSRASSPSLYTLPAELLLTIIAYLPTSSYGPLTQTSHTLKTFFTHNASRICNQRILTHHSAKAAILQASFSATDSIGNTWLVPTHSAIAQAEKSLWNPKNYVPSLRPIHPSEDTHALKKRMLLSQPGPQFLLFLERRGWEMQTQYSMCLDIINKLQNAEQKETLKMLWDDYVSSDSRVQMIAHDLSWSLERGPVRGFLAELSNFAETFGEVEQTTEDELHDTPLRAMRTRVHSKAKTLTTKLRSLGRRKPQPQPEQRRLLFGEIPNDTEKFGVSVEETEIDGLAEGLLWYHGRAGVSGYPPPVVEETYRDIPLSQRVVEKKYVKRCMRSIVKRASKSGRKMKYVFRKGWSCGNGSFESLD
jgi:hypothetical protein